MPDAVTLVGLIAPQVRPDGGLSVRETMPLKWLIGVILMVEMTEVPALTGAGEDANVLKSQNWKIVVAL